MVYYIRGKFHNGSTWEDKARNKDELGRSFYAAHNNAAIQRDTITVSTKYKTLSDMEVLTLLDE